MYSVLYKKRHLWKSGQRGVSLIETVVVLSLFSVLMLAVLTAIDSFYQFNAYSIAQSFQIQHARRGVEFFQRDMREMTYADDGAFPLVTKSTSSIIFFSDIDRDDSVEYVRYELVDTVLFKYVHNATGSPAVYDVSTPDEIITISEYVQNSINNIPMFAYYDTDGVLLTATSSVSDVRYISSEVIINIDPVRDPGVFSLRSSAAPRNLQDQI